MLPAIDIVRKVAPNCHPNYVAGIRNGGAMLDAYGITTPLRMAHFLAQFVGHETMGGTVLRESGNYRAARILEIFGVGKHSAAVTKAEAAKLAMNGPALFDRVYGVGNPKKSAELGNLRPGDGWLFRGGGLPQLTGGSAYRSYGFGSNPDEVTSAERCLEVALRVWKAKNCNALADRNDIRAITKAINGGYNGYDDRVKWFNKIWPLVRESDGPAESWKVAEASESTKLLQRQLVALGYDLKVDGRVGPKTTEAIIAFQRANGLRVDGIAGKVTVATIEARLDSDAPNIGSATHEVPAVAKPAAGGMSLAMAGEVGQKMVDQAQTLQPYTGLSDAIGWACAGLTTVGVAIAAYAVIRSFVIPAIWPPKVVVPA